MLSRRELFSAAAAAATISAAYSLFATQRLSQAELIDIARRHGLWLDGRPGGAFADLRGANLSGLCLDGLDLSQADLTDASLAGAYGTGFVCLQGRLVRADLAGVQLVGPALDGANLAFADLRAAYLGDGVEIMGDPPTRAQLDQRASFLGASFLFANLSDSRISAYLSGTSFQGADLARANLSLCRGSADFRHATLAGTAFDDCEFKVVDFTDAELQRCIFNRTTARRGHNLPNGIQAG